MRSPEISLNKPPGTYRVAILGDSYTFGWGVQQDKPFPRVMERELNKTQPNGRRFEVLNFGVPGYATFQEVGLFFEKGVQFKPDAVIVYVISNDFGLPFFIRDLGGNDPSSLVSGPEFHSTKIDPADAEKMAKRNELLKALDANRALIELGRYCEKQGIKLFVVVHPDNAEDKTREKLWAIRGKNNLTLMTPWRITDDYKRLVDEKVVSEESLHLPRDHHPGPGAHQIIGTVLARRLLKELDGGSSIIRHASHFLCSRATLSS
jgi:hypothetical protein